MSKEEYKEKMQEASKDKEFMKRTMEVQKEFDNIETEVDKEWQASSNGNI